MGGGGGGYHGGGGGPRTLDAEPYITRVTAACHV